MPGVQVVTEDLKHHPHCAHGPTVLFSRLVEQEHKKYFACSACRDRKDCSFFLWEEAFPKVSKEKLHRWADEKTKMIKGVNHREMFIHLNKLLQVQYERRVYCKTCDKIMEITDKKGHKEHDFKDNLTDYELAYPSEFLTPLDNSKKEAQFLFSKTAVKTIVSILEDLKFSDVLCIGTPRIFEEIVNTKPEINALLLDIDKRYHNFFGPLQFCWYNCFNHYFFLPEAKQVFLEFLKSSKNLCIIMDPPFGGRVELLAATLKTINGLHKRLNNVETELSMFWIFPYFMEPQIQNSLPNFTMLDYKVDYDNHPLFQKGPKGRKMGSPVRIFTNLNPSLIKLPKEEGYKLCPACSRYVSIENVHCPKCDSCSSKDGTTYVHCDICQRCVKPTWQHCDVCKRCRQKEHKCGDIPEFNQACFHCHEKGHKKRECPKVDHEDVRTKRKRGEKVKTSNKKKKKK